MTTPSHYIGLREFVEDLATLLSRAPLDTDYNNDGELCGWLGPVVKAYLANNLGQQNLSYDLWQRRSRKKKDVAPLTVFGCNFAPDFSIKVSGAPTLAVLSILVKDNRALPKRIGSAIGQAMVLSHQYPAVLSFVLHPGKQEEPYFLLEREIQLDLWSRHKVKLVLRDQFSSRRSQRN